MAIAKLGAATIAGATDGTLIGNVADRLKVDTAITSVPVAITTSFSSKLRYVDMNAASGGVARGTTITVAAGWTDVFNYSGSGVVIGWLVNPGIGTNWNVRFVVDGEELFIDGTNGIAFSDILGTSVYHLNANGSSTDDAQYGLSVSTDDRIQWRGPLGIPVRFSSSVVVKIKRSVSSNTFDAGLMIIQKDT